MGSLLGHGATTPSTELVYQDGSQVQPMEEGTRQDEVEVEEKEADEASKKAQDEAEIQVNAWMKQVERAHSLRRLGRKEERGEKRERGRGKRAFVCFSLSAPLSLPFISHQQ